ncbi:MAG: S8 family serine peptidase [Gemmatimonadales bacterium]|nr:S8 family serine peptidase [Gemmatimonadales bacterium]
MTRPIASRLGFLALLLALTVTRCGGDGAGPSQPTPAAIALVSGNSQADTVGQVLNQPLVVRVTTSAGAGVPGVSVSWAMTAGGGTLSGSTIATDANGQASVTWTLGTTAGTNNNTATATVSGLAGSPVTFMATANPGPATQFVLTSGSGQTGAAGQPLPQPLIVGVKDQYGNAVKDVAVTWAVTAGGGGVSASSVATDALGSASVTWTLGTTAGTNNNTATATVAGLTGSPTTFTASATPGPASHLTLVSGDAQTAQVAQTLGQPLVVALRDQYGNGITGVAVSWAAVLGGGSVSASSVPTDAEGKSSVSRTLGTTAGNQTTGATVTGVGGSPVTFTATADPGPATQLAIASGDNQTAPAATSLPLALNARAADTYGNGVSGITVSWSVVTGGGTLSAATSQTGTDGVATIQWTLGRFAGTQTATAAAGALQGSPRTFTATATPNATISGTVTLTNAYLAPPQAAKVAAVADAVAAPLFQSPKPSPTGGISELSRAASGGALARTPSRSEYVPGELVVTFRAGALGAPRIGSLALAAPATAKAVAATIRSLLTAREAAGQLRTTGISPAVLAARVQVADPARLDEVLAALRQDPAVAAVERNQMRYASGFGGTPTLPATTANDLLYPLQAWHYAMIDLPQAWDITRGSASVLVAVIDDGIRFDHPDIAGNLTADGFDFVSNVIVPVCAGGTVGAAGDGNGYDSEPRIPVVYDYDAVLGCVVGSKPDGGHGLHVAGTIGAVGNNGVGVTGVNWTVRIRPVRALSSLGSGSNYDIAQAVLYAAGLPADNGAGGTVAPASAARVINMSLGGPGVSTVMHDAIIQATTAGALVVAAAGNDGTSTPNYPAAFDEVLSVSAVGPDAVLASYSTFGSTVDIAAPGGDLADGGCSYGVTSTWWDFATTAPTYNCIQGTSMAAPHVTGVAALLLAQSPGLTAAALRARLTSYAIDVGAAGRDDSYGAGIVNARNSLTQSFAPPRQVYARLYDALSGAAVGTSLTQPDGSYAFTALPDGSYYMYAGQDESGDQRIGEPGRRWGAYGGSPVPTSLGVSGAGTYPASFTIGFPVELESNDTPALADALPVGGYLTGFTSSTSDGDYSRVRVAQSGQYTFETSAVDGACGFALEGDTILELFDAAGNLLASNDDISFSTYNLCSRISMSLLAGTYYVRVSPYFTGPGRYRVQARSGP